MRAPVCSPPGSPFVCSFSFPSAPLPLSPPLPFPLPCTCSNTNGLTLSQHFPLGPSESPKGRPRLGGGEWLLCYFGAVSFFSVTFRKWKWVGWWQASALGAFRTWAPLGTRLHAGPAEPAACG